MVWTDEVMAQGHGASNQAPSTLRACSMFLHGTLRGHVADRMTVAQCVPPQCLASRDTQQAPRDSGEMACPVACVLSEVEGNGFSPE